MKNKFRKIVIDNNEFTYTMSNKHNWGKNTCTLTIRIYLAENKKTPLVIEFLTIDDYLVGQLLKSGVNLKNNIQSKEVFVNLNEPKYIRELILQGFIKGWNGNNKIEKQNGIDYLSELGFEIEKILPIPKVALK